MPPKPFKPPSRVSAPSASTSHAHSSASAQTTTNTHGLDGTTHDAPISMQLKDDPMFEGLTSSVEISDHEPPQSDANSDPEPARRGIVSARKMVFDSDDADSDLDADSDAGDDVGDPIRIDSSSASPPPVPQSRGRGAAGGGTRGRGRGKGGAETASKTRTETASRGATAPRRARGIARARGATSARGKRARTPSLSPDPSIVQPTVEPSGRHIMTAAELEERIPRVLLSRLVHDAFKHQDTRITSEAMTLLHAYIDLFAREAVHRSMAVRDERGESGEFLSVDDLEVVVPQIVLDFAGY